MPSASCEILIIGAGVLGLATAAELALRGRVVTVVDPGGVNASTVAAGMIAPAMESALENVTRGRADLLRAARDLWPDFADAVGVTLSAEGSEWRGPDAAGLTERLLDLGFAAWVEDGAAVTPDDWRVEPPAALAALGAVRGVTRVEGRVDALEPLNGGWMAQLAAGRWIQARQVVLATGAAAAVPGLPSEARRIVELIRPIRGQLEQIAGPTVARMTRGQGAYAAPMTGGVIVGASMDFDRDDLTSDEGQARRILQAAARFCDLSPTGPRRTLVGVRGASPDGLPIAGGLGQGLFAALAPRRNGWLLAAAVAAVAADAVQGEPKTAFAAAFDPMRF